MATNSRPKAGQQIRVLLIDENPVFLRAATAFLKRQSELVLLRSSARIEAALAGAREFGPAVILLVPSMRGCHGLGIIRRLRTVLPDVRIVVLALIDSTTYQEASLAAGADGFVSKAHILTDLLPAIRQATEYGSDDLQETGLPAITDLREARLAGLGELPAR